MTRQRYSVTQYPIDGLINLIKCEEIAVPEIQRPFVWDATKVRNLLDSLYQGYPIGYLITWRNPTVKLKDGSSAAGKRILIDGQQRVTALMAALLGKEVLTRNYETVRIRIAFNPKEARFEVCNPAIEKDPEWIPDISVLFSQGLKLFKVTKSYVESNPTANEDAIAETLERLGSIINNDVGLIELAEDLDIETVTEIFIRVNSAGVTLSQADFAMSKIAANESYGGNMLRKAIDYFCHLAVVPEFYDRVKRSDLGFAASEFFPRIAWLSRVNDDIYDPSYTDMLRVAFTSEFRRGKLQDLVALLSGRNFDTKQYEDRIAEESFGRLKKGILNFVNENHFKRLVIILRSAGFIRSSLLGSHNALNFSYIIYLLGRDQRLPSERIANLVRCWFVMSLLTGRYSGNPETAFDEDVRQIDARGLEKYIHSTIQGELSESFWTTLLPQRMETSSVSSPYFSVYQAAQVKLNDKGFLSRDITVQDLLLIQCDVHHVYPRSYLKKLGFSRARYNQIANFVLAQSEINIAIGNKKPEVYFKELAEQCSGGKRKYGSIQNRGDMESNLKSHCIPVKFLEGEIPEYEEFLEERRKLMAAKIRDYFQSLSIHTAEA